MGGIEVAMRYVYSVVSLVGHTASIALACCKADQMLVLGLFGREPFLGDISYDRCVGTEKLSCQVKGPFRKYCPKKWSVGHKLVSANNKKLWQRRSA